MPRLLLGLVATVLVVAAPADARAPCVAAVAGFDLADLSEREQAGSVGLVVPDAGPETSGERARASLLRGETRNSLRGELPTGPPVVQLEPACRPVAVRVGIPAGGNQPNDRRFAIVAADGGGLLASDSTRIVGLVSIADVGQGRLEVRPHDEPVDYLRSLDARIRENGEVRLTAAGLAAALIAALAFLFPRAAVLSFAALLGGNLVLGALEVSGWRALAGLLAAVVAGGPMLALVARSPVAVGAVLAGTVATYTIALGLDPELVALSPLGPSQNGRFYGVSNLLETLLLVPALVGVGLLARRFGPAAFAALAVLALITVAGSRLGADAGGAIVLVAGYAVLAAGLIRPDRRLPAALVAVGVLGALLAIDVALGPSTHLSESIREGPGSLASDIWQRVELSYLRATSSWADGIAIVAALVALGALVVRLPRVGDSHARRLLVAFAVSVAVSLVVNDSPREVAVGGLVGYLAVLSYAVDRAAPRTIAAR